MNASRRKSLDTAMDLINKIKSDFEEAKGILETASEEEREYYDNMPEGLQSGDKGSDADQAASGLEEAFQSLDELDLDDILSKIDEAKGS
jgi:hypothetical protein